MAFRCYVCDRERSDKQFGEIRGGKRVCKFCSPYVDDRDVNSMILHEQQARAHRPKKVGRDRNK